MPLAVNARQALLHCGLLSLGPAAIGDAGNGRRSPPSMNSLLAITATPQAMPRILFPAPNDCLVETVHARLATQPFVYVSRPLGERLR